MPYDRPIGVITIACEASSCPDDTKLGVAASLFNRLKDGRFGKTIAGICLKRFQYSEWNADAPDNANLERVANMAEGDAVIVDCAFAYDQAAAGIDNTNGATHFYANWIAEPAWAKLAEFTVELNGVRFYRNVP